VHRLYCMNEPAHFSEWQHRISVADDQEAFLMLYRYFKKRLEKFAYSICHSKEDAEDIVEDVFVRIWSRRKTLDQILNLKLYLYIATRNFSLNYLKANNRNVHFDPDSLKMEVEDFAPDPQQRMVDKELVTRVNYAVSNLPSRCKAIYKLVKEDGLKHKEVAEILQVSPKTVENQIAIAVRKIAATIGHQLNIKVQASSDQPPLPDEKF
jgi:RNA polymerase sigma-70 factor (family 1)